MPFIGYHFPYRLIWFPEGAQELPPRGLIMPREWRSGSASPCQGEGRGFESRLPLHEERSTWAHGAGCAEVPIPKISTWC